MPESTPDVEIMDPTTEAVLLHVPPLVPSVSVVTLPTQISDEPDIATGEALTVTDATE
jgi:hypothetical protein